MPLLVTDMGALSERMRQDQTGWMISSQADDDRMLATVKEIFANEEGYRAVCQRIENFHHKTILEMCRDYDALYAPYDKQRKDRDFDAQAVFNAYALCQSDCAGFAGAVDGNMLRRLNELEATMNTINQSLEYRMVKFFNREKIPGKKLIKWMIGFAYRVYLKFFRR